MAENFTTIKVERSASFWKIGSNCAEKCRVENEEVEEVEVIIIRDYRSSMRSRFGELRSSRARFRIK